MRAGAFAAIAIFVVGSTRLLDWLRAPHSHALQTFANVPSASDATLQSREQLRFFEARVARNPGDMDVLNRLSALYLQRLRESGSFSDLDLALRASRRSLSVVPPVRNVPGLTSRTMAEFASHQFEPARDDARELLQLDGSGTAYALLGDAEAELGNYPAAEAAYERLRHRFGELDENVATRRARMDVLHGDNIAAMADFQLALSLELERTAPSAERAAWYSWQIGDTAFFMGDDATAEARYRDALTVYPGYFRALASLGRLDAARGRYAEAERAYGEAIRTLPDPTFVAELGDVYTLAGDRASAKREYDLVEFTGHLSAINGVMYNRQLVMFEADHGMRTMDAYRSAKREYAVRRDILGADAVAWTALKAGKIHDARDAMLDAIRLGTADPRLLYHAGMIEHAAGNDRAARVYLERALGLNPKFDPFQSLAAQRTLTSLAKSPQRS